MRIKNPSPMLACHPEGELRFPYLASAKYDGIRAVNFADIFKSRTLTDIPNMYCQALAAPGSGTLGMDGEFIDGPPTASDVFQKTTSTVMSDFNIPEHISFNVFDDITMKGYTYAKRYDTLLRRFAQEKFPFGVQLVKHVQVNNMTEMLELEDVLVTGMGFEGIMLRSLDGDYKYGRATWKEGTLLKIKRFADAEGVCVGLYEGKTNNNEKTISNLGNSKRSSHKDNKVLNGRLGGFLVETSKWGQLRVGTGKGLTHALRALYWGDPKSCIGKTVKFKYQLVGTKDLPRQPIFHGFRDRRDL